MAFVTLIERKILGFSQNRLGPNKVGILGILQPFGDALKLFLKQNENNINANNFIFYVTPVIIFVITASLTFFQPHEITFTGQTIRRLLFVFLLAMRVYPLLLRG